jgi:uncharacterized alkaline shock family protein YloU
MTDIVSGVPTQRSDDAEPDAAPASEVGGAPASEAAVVSTAPAVVDGQATTTSTVDSPTALERAQDVAERVGERAGEVAAQVGERAGVVAAQVSEAVGDAVERATQASGRVAAAVVDRLRNNAELIAERGTTTIANEVVEKIAGISAREVPGVYDLGGDVARVFAAVKERIGLGEAEEDNRGVRVRLEGGTAAINITIVIEFGFVVHSVTEKVRAKVITAVENLLGLEVTEVNIVVDDVHFEDSGPKGDDEDRAATFR